jgi:hypothetical protein
VVAAAVAVPVTVIVTPDEIAPLTVPEMLYVVTTDVIVYVPLATAESTHPAKYAIALIVVVADTAIGPAYTVPVVEVGVDPSVVYRMLAPGVAVDSVTLWALVYAPAAGLNAGADAVPAILKPMTNPYRTAALVFVRTIMSLL